MTDEMKQLIEDAAKLLGYKREKVEEAERIEAIAAMKLGEALVKLSSAQATIAQMREALEWAMGFADSAISDGLWELGGESISDETHREAKQYWESETKTFDQYKPLLTPPTTNQDARHELLAKECERLAEECCNHDSPIGNKLMHAWLREEAAAHRAKKEVK